MWLSKHQTVWRDFIVGIIVVLAVWLFAAALKSVNRTPAVLPALVTIWTESITFFYTSSVAPTPNFSLWHHTIAGLAIGGAI